jgi:hypothetical protein
MREIPRNQSFSPPTPIAHQKKWKNKSSISTATPHGRDLAIIIT